MAEKGVIRNVKQVWDRFIAGFCTPGTDDEGKRRITLLVGLSGIGIFNLALFGSIAFYQGNLLLGTADFVAFAVLLLNLHDAGRRKRTFVNILFGSVFVGVFYAFLFVSGGEKNTAFVWCYTYPLIACYLLGARLGGIASSSLIFPVLLHFMFAPGPPFAVYPIDFKVRFFFSYLVVGWFSFLFEYTREKNREELLRTHSALEDTIRDLNAAKDALKASMEGRLRESDARYKELVDLLPQSVFEVDAKGKLTFGNRHVLDKFGFTQDDVRNGLEVIPLFVPEDRDRAGENVRRALNGEKRVGEEYTMLRKDGSKVHVVIYSSPIVCNNETVGLRGVLVDITDRKQVEEEKLSLERQVQQAQKMDSLGVLAGGIAHDFNNLLMVILGNAEMVLEKISMMPAARHNLTEILTAGNRAAELCRQMLAYAGKASFALERVGLRELVEEMAHLLKTAISKKAILNLNLERDLPPIQADPGQIRQIVMNLIINASEAIGDRSGVITVSVGATRCDEESLRKTELREALSPGLYVHLEVTDTGAGMDAETRARIFEPFFSTKFTGRGLGLAAVLGIVRAHKGALKVYSEPGKGTTFKILFPALEDAESGARTDDPSPLADWRGEGTILLVDDEEILIALGARMLEHLGFTVLTAADGLQAVELYRELGKDIDLVLMDLTMPHMDGAAAFGELRRLNPAVRVVLASGYSQEDVSARFAGKGLDGVLQKPYTLLNLREALAGSLPKRQAGEG